MNLDHCDRLFSEVRQATTPASVCHALEPLFAAYDVISFELTRNIVFWRARFARATPWPTLAEMAYPRDGCAPPGRLSDGSTPCLYAATSAETALREVGAKENDFVQLIGFRVKLETPIRLAVIGEMLHVRKTGHVRLTGIDPGGSIARHLRSERPRARELLYIDEFLAHQLSDIEADKSNYLRSRAVAAMVYRNSEIDGILFPSVREQYGMNVALQPAATDSKIHPVLCFHARIARIRDYGLIDYEVLTEVEQITPDGRFVWAEALSPPEQRLFNLTPEEYEVAVRNAADPEVFAKVLSVYNRRS